MVDKNNESVHLGERVLNQAVFDAAIKMYYPIFFSIVNLNDKQVRTTLG